MYYFSLPFYVAFILFPNRVNYFINPLARASFKQAEIPFLLIVRIAEVDTFKVMNVFSSGIKNFLVTKFGENLLFVLRLE